MMQFMWRYVDELIGKGLTLDVLAHFFYYAGLTLIPMSLPLAILLASLITFGNLGERFELLSMKAAGIPLVRILRPLIEDQDPYDLVETVTRIFSYIQEHADLCLVTLGPNSDKKLLYRLVELGKQACLNSQLTLFPHADPRMLDYYYTFVSSGCIAILEKWMKEGMPEGSAHLAAFVRTLIVNGDHVMADRL